ncbi:MAG: hypothetical protein IT428_29450 [Planctomycetaceae bacterium]|nr:hypothetical protein [Planctomycetaceae bacterium]
MAATRILLMSALLGTKCWLMSDAFTDVSDVNPGPNPGLAAVRQSAMPYGVEAISLLCVFASAFRCASSLIVPNTGSRFELVDEAQEIIA